jgi:hypothetical protein
VLVLQHFHFRRRSRVRNGLPEYIGFGDDETKGGEVILTMMMSRLMMNFSRRELIHRFHP